MDPENLIQIISNVGFPAAILVWLIWRFDKFLTFICKKLEVYNGELKDIFCGLTDITTELKEIKTIAKLGVKK